MRVLILLECFEAEVLNCQVSQVVEPSCSQIEGAVPEDGRWCAPEIDCLRRRRSPTGLQSTSPPRNEPSYFWLEARGSFALSLAATLLYETAAAAAARVFTYFASF